MPDSPHRLPENVRPVCYRLTLEPDLTAFTFAGQAEIEIDVKEPTAEITLNAAELRIESAEVRPSPYPSPRGGQPSPYPSPRGRGNQSAARTVVSTLTRLAQCYSIPTRLGVVANRSTP